MMTSPAPPRLIIADINQLLVKALRDVFEKSGRFASVEASVQGTAVIEALSGDHADAALVGWRLADMTAGDIVQSLRHGRAPPRITVLGSDQNHALLHRCIQLGVMGFCWHGDEPETLVDTVLSVCANRLSLPYVDMSKLGRSPFETLTARERDLLKALSDGWSNIQIAARFGISENTVKYHLKNMYDKLGVKNRAMAITVFHTDGRDEGSG
jgi:DNA-binding NarL/FixJ family response regulator